MKYRGVSGAVLGVPGAVLGVPGEVPGEVLGVKISIVSTLAVHLQCHTHFPASVS